MTQYRKGYERERTVRKKLEADGWFVIRSAGSHTPVDLVAFKPGYTVIPAPAGQTLPGLGSTLPYILFCQCKGSRGLTRAAKQELRELAHRYGARPVLAGPRGQFQYLDEDEAA